MAQITPELDTTIFSGWGREVEIGPRAGINGHRRLGGLDLTPLNPRRHVATWNTYHQLRSRAENAWNMAQAAYGARQSGRIGKFAAWDIARGVVAMAARNVAQMLRVRAELHHRGLLAHISADELWNLDRKAGAKITGSHKDTRARAPIPTGPAAKAA